MLFNSVNKVTAIILFSSLPPPTEASLSSACVDSRQLMNEFNITTNQTVCFERMFKQTSSGEKQHASRWTTLSFSVQKNKRSPVMQRK